MPTDLATRKPLAKLILALLAFDSLGLGLLVYGFVLWSSAPAADGPKPPLALVLMILGALVLGAGLAIALLLAVRGRSSSLNRPRT